MSKKYTYCLSTPDYKSKNQDLVYQFSSTKNIHLNISEKGFRIQVSMWVKKEPEKIFQDVLFRDAIRKAAILRLISYNNASIKQLVFKVDDHDEIVVYVESQDPKLYWLMSEEKLPNKIPDCFKSQEFNQFFVNMVKSNYDRRIASLNAYIMAKSKKYEMEKFTYLWIAMAGMYEYLGEVVRKQKYGNNPKKITESEIKEISFLAYYAGKKFYSPKAIVPKGTSREEKEKLQDQIDRLYRESLKNILDQVSFEECDEVVQAIRDHDSTNLYIEKIDQFFTKNPLDEPANLYVFVMLWLSYKMRCNYFHSEKAYMLFAFNNESPIGTIRVLNRLLEDYLDHHLYEIMKTDDQLKDCYAQICKTANLYELVSGNPVCNQESLEL